MKATYQPVPRIALGACAVLTALLGACTVPQSQLQSPLPAAPIPRAAPPPPAPAVTADWHDVPATVGVWRWQREGRFSVARFGNPASFSLSCDPLAGVVSLNRATTGAAVRTLSILTTSVSRSLPARAGSDQAGAGRVTANLAARDPLLDAMAYSRGRFAVEVPGLATLYLPSWPEVSRVIEDCRLAPIARRAPDPPAEPASGVQY